MKIILALRQQFAKEKNRHIAGSFCYMDNSLYA